MLGPKGVPKFLTILVGSFVLCCGGISGKRISEQKCDEYKTIISSKVGITDIKMRSKVTYHNVNHCSHTVDLIAGGEAARHGEFPHHAVLGYPQEDGISSGYRFICGGSLISDRFVMTAAHCFSHGNPVLVRLGEYDLNQESASQVDFGITKIIRHPKYKNSLSYHDIALIRLNETVDFSNIIRPACLWTQPALKRRSFVATGFGKLEQSATELSPRMMKVKLKKFPAKDCRQLFDGLRMFNRGIRGGQLCVGSKDGKDTCQGDSGGPLQIITEPGSCMYNIVGVTSTGPFCGIPNARAIYTNVAYYLNWIENIVWLQ